MKKIKDYIKNMGWLGLPNNIIRLDLQQHAIVGFFLVIPFYIFPHFTLGLSKLLSLILAVTVSGIIGTAKEIRDSKQPNNKFDKLDLIFTVGATLIGSLLLVIFR